GLRAALLFNGEYAEAHALSVDLAKEHHPDLTLRDNVLLALTERINGNRKPLDDTIGACPAAPQVERDRWMNGEADDCGTNYCRMMALWDVDRAIAVAPRATLPHAYVEFLQESASSAIDSCTRPFAINDLQRVDVDLAKREWQSLRTAPQLPQEVRDKALWGLSWIAEQKKQWGEAIEWIDHYIQAKYRQPVAFSPDLWRDLASMPESSASWNGITE